VNTEVLARPCWSLLAKKAQDEAELIQQHIAQTRQRLTKLQASRERLQQMYDEYCQQLNRPGSSSQGMREAMGQRQFMAQLLTLLERVNTDIAHATNHLVGYRERLLAAEKERMKMQSLAEQNERDLNQQTRKKEQRRMDELGVMQFNQRSAL
jgi:flagellar export protein FliJ